MSAEHRDASIGPGQRRRIESQAIGQDRRMKVQRRAACRRAASGDSEAPHLPLPGRPHQAPPHHSWGGAFSCGSTHCNRQPLTAIPPGTPARFRQPQERADPWHACTQASRSQGRDSTHSKRAPVETPGAAAHREPLHAEAALRNVVLGRVCGTEPRAPVAHPVLTPHRPRPARTVDCERTYVRIGSDGCRYISPACQ